MLPSKPTRVLKRKLALYHNYLYPMLWPLCNELRGMRSQAQISAEAKTLGDLFPSIPDLWTEVLNT